MRSGGIRRLAISVRERSSEEPSAEGGTDLAFPRPQYPGRRTRPLQFPL